MANERKCPSAPETLGTDMTEEMMTKSTSTPDEEEVRRHE
jgi:hypothetical protein